MKRQSVNIALKTLKNDNIAREELLAGGGRVKVPCLKITENGKETWNV
ncbi:glutaredoxin [Vibrio variabilis]|uniref:Glutaredoxin n=1 Tax=Vibrio variabilis TaxID=990271 RepID=A0ABQ0JPE1_9VIBR|nr:glutaredoxin [Vibrio variabilis]